MVFLFDDKSVFSFATKISSVLPKFINSVVIEEPIKNFQQLSIELKSQKDIIPVLSFLKNHSGSLFLSIADITAVDWLGSIGGKNSGIYIKDRFQLIYLFTSHYFNSRIKIVCFLNDNDVALSVCGLFKGANWLEREVYDMFGIFFVNHFDLRRILTDYGFDGYPLRKDFPLTGYTDIRYDDTEKCLVYEPLELSQELRSFDTLSPWSNS